MSNNDIPPVPRGTPDNNNNDGVSQGAGAVMNNNRTVPPAPTNPYQRTPRTPINNNDR